MVVMTHGFCHAYPGDRMLTPNTIRHRACAILFALVIAPGCAGLRASLEKTQKPETLELAVAGLHAPAVIRVDTWGVPHIEAQTHYDAFFVQGFNAARDRLWQIDTWRRRGLGRLAEVFGEAYVEQDRAARLFLYRGSMYREWLAYGSDAKKITDSFVAGINAWITLTRAQPEYLAPEFALLGYAPQRWAPEDVVRIRSHGLWRNIKNEVRRARLQCHVDPRRIPLFMPLEPQWTAKVPSGLEVCELPPDDVLLHDYRLATAGVDFGPAMARVRPTAVSTAAQHRPVDRWSLEGLGSNNWAVAPSRTASGRPILADDPHRGHAVPSLRYVVHLKAPGLNVIGAGEPALPGISIGHNDRIGFGLTIFAVDQEDLYVYETHPDDPHAYRYGDGYERVRVIRETVKIAGHPDQDVELLFTRHGPVLFIDPDHHRMYAARVAWLEPGMAPYFGSIEYMRATNWRQFVAALNRWGAPAENQVYADIDGHIGYKPAGLAPRRSTWDGLFPVPGDGRYEWQDFISMDQLPEAFDPDAGWVATANQMGLPADYPIAERRLGFEWSAPWRYRRIASVLERQTAHSVDDSLALQRDYGSFLAKDVVAALPRFEPEGFEPDARQAAALLERHARHSGAAGFVMGIDQPAAALFGVWYHRHLRPALGRLLAPADFVPTPMPDSRGVVAALHRPQTYGVDPAPLRQLVESTLTEAWRQTVQLLGPEPRRWRWGDIHQARFRHPLWPLADPQLRAAMDIPARPRGGDVFTPNNTAMPRTSFDVVAGASFRMVLDVGRWDAGRMTTAPAQSGVPGSRHYRDLVDVWADSHGVEGSVPLLFSEDAIRAHTRYEIRLRPHATE